jgi:hypothetical protein
MRNTGRRVRFIDFVLRVEGLLYYGGNAKNVAQGPGIKASVLDNKRADNSSGNLGVG